MPWEVNLYFTFQDDDSMDKDGNDLDGECSRPQKHAKSPELAREFLLDAATVIFKEQVCRVCPLLFTVVYITPVYENNVFLLVSLLFLQSVSYISCFF